MPSTSTSLYVFPIFSTVCRLAASIVCRLIALWLLLFFNQNVVSFTITLVLVASYFVLEILLVTPSLPLPISTTLRKMLLSQPKLNIVIVLCILYYSFNVFAHITLAVNQFQYNLNKPGPTVCYDNLGTTPDTFDKNVVYSLYDTVAAPEYLSFFTSKPDASFNYYTLSPMFPKDYGNITTIDNLEYFLQHKNLWLIGWDENDFIHHFEPKYVKWVDEDDSSFYQLNSNIDEIIFDMMQTLERSQAMFKLVDYSFEESITKINKKKSIYRVFATTQFAFGLDEQTSLLMVYICDFLWLIILVVGVVFLRYLYKKSENQNSLNSYESLDMEQLTSA
jgi:hypothetical protein